MFIGCGFSTDHFLLFLGVSVACIIAPLGRRPKGLHGRLMRVCMYVCHRGHYVGLSRCRLVGSCVLPGENFFT